MTSKNRIELKFQQLKQNRKKAFIAFLTAGDPDLDTTCRLVLEFEKAGVDLIELGVPFSDPLADGPVIQASYARALAHHVNLPQILDLVKKIRKSSQIPLALMSSYNPVFHYDQTRLVKDASQAGVDGLIIPDLPVKEAKDLIAVSRQMNMSTIFFAAPTTSPQRMPQIIKASRGFIYYISLTGVTGMRSQLPENVLKEVRVIKSMTEIPVCVGFGISTRAQAKAVADVADGVIIGSAIIKSIEQNLNNKSLVQKVTEAVVQLKP